MKYLGIILIFFALSGCNPDGVGCFKSTGSIETVTVSVTNFTAIDVSNNIEVHISNRPLQEVKLTAGSNLIPGIRMEVIDGVLFLENLNTCNWSREYINPIVEISIPALTNIVQQGFGKIISTETLTYDSLMIENRGGAGDFRIDVDMRSLVITSNEVANFYITGVVAQLRVGFYYSDEIFFGEGLKATDCDVTHYGSNSIHLDVSGSLSGTINSFGDVIMHHQLPQNIDVQEGSNGKLIFKP